MATFAEDPCGCHSTLAEHEAATKEAAQELGGAATSVHPMIVPPTTEFVGQYNGMEFGDIHVYDGVAPMPPLVPLLLLLVFATTFVRHCRNPVRYVTFKQLLYQTPQRHGPSLFPQNLMLAFPFRHLQLHEMETEKRCAYCKDAFNDTREAFSCSVCATPHHRDCYIDHCGCAVFGCTLSGRPFS